MASTATADLTFFIKHSQQFRFDLFQVSIELVTDNRDLSSHKSQNNLTAGTTPSPRRETSSTTQRSEAGRGDLPAESRMNGWSPDISGIEPSSQLDLQTSSRAPRLGGADESEVLLYTLLMVPDGRNFGCGSTKAPSVYLNCKLFWSDAIAQSVVSWGQANPSFRFVQVGTRIIPNKSKKICFPLCSILLTPKLYNFASGDSCGFNK